MKTVNTAAALLAASLLLAACGKKEEATPAAEVAPPPAAETPRLRRNPHRSILPRRRTTRKMPSSRAGTRSSPELIPPCVPQPAHWPAADRLQGSAFRDGSSCMACLIQPR